MGFGESNPESYKALKLNITFKINYILYVSCANNTELASFTFFFFKIVWFTIDSTKQ